MYALAVFTVELSLPRHKQGLEPVRQAPGQDRGCWPMEKPQKIIPALLVEKLWLADDRHASSLKIIFCYCDSFPARRLNRVSSRGRENQKTTRQQENKKIKNWTL